MFYVNAGLVTISVVSSNGREAVTGVRGRGDLFGVRSLLRGHYFLGTVAALTDCVVISVKKDAMRRMLQQELAFADWFISYLIRRYLRDQEWLVDQLTNSAEKRVARVCWSFPQPTNRRASIKPQCSIPSPDISR